MFNWLKNTINSISAKGGIFMFIRAQLSAQVATIVDFLVSIILVNFFSLYYIYATITGAVCGGVVNCVINYYWTFKATNVNKKLVAFRYTMIWLGSIFFNTGGVYVIMESIRNFFSTALFNDIFIIIKIIVAVIVGFTWNYYMQRVFVYKGKNS